MGETGQKPPLRRRKQICSTEAHTRPTSRIGCNIDRRGRVALGLRV